MIRFSTATVFRRQQSAFSLHHKQQTTSAASAFLLSCFSYCSSSSSSSTSSRPVKSEDKIKSSSVFHDVSEHFIEEASIVSDELLDRFPAVVEDSAMSDGVLQIKTSQGTFVLNKQAPLHQLWLSSPVSGPHHYDYDTQTKTWKSDKDGHDLQGKIEKELSGVCQVDVSLTK